MILVTGGTGLVGSHLLFELTKQGQEIRAIRRENSSVEFVLKVFSLYSTKPEVQFALIKWVNADLLDYSSLLEATKGITTVFHTGAVVSLGAGGESAIIETNVTGTANLLEASLTNDVKNFCHVSSIAALGEPNEQGVVDESCSWSKRKGINAYAKSKFLGEMEVWRASEQGIRVIIVNPSVILGPGRWSSGSGQFFSRVAKGMPFYTDGVTGYVDVRDVAKAMVLLVNNKSIVNQRYILNSGNVSFRELFSMISDSLGVKPPRIRINRRTANLLWPVIRLVTLLAGLGTAVSKSTFKSAFTKTFYSSQKIIRELHFAFIPVAESINFAGSIYKQKEIE